MAHHTDNEHFNYRPEDMKQFLDSAKIKTQPDSEIGATGQYPDGKISDNDEGGILFRVAVIDKVITFDFGKPVRSVGFTRDEAMQLATMLFEKARTI